MFWAQLLLLAILLLEIVLQAACAHKEGWKTAIGVMVLVVLSYFAGAFSEVIEWLK